MSNEIDNPRSGWPTPSDAAGSNPIIASAADRDSHDANVDQGRVEELERQLMIGNLKVKRQRRPSMARSTGVRIIRHGVKLFDESSE